MSGSDGVDARCDVLVIGGGVCGLWTLHALVDAGYNAMLIERSALGDGQTIASQGILHAGAKYNLPGNAVDAAPAVAAAQGVWRAALAGEAGVPDLSGVRVLDERTLLWTMPSLSSRAAAVGAGRVMRSAVTKVGRGDWPAGFAGAPRGVDVYETAECVLEPASLLGELGRGHRERIGLGDVIGIESSADGVCVTLDDRGSSRVVACGAVVLAAGAGNEGLLDLAGADGSALMQRRALHQIVAVGAPFDLNGHCLQMSVDKPALTVTTGMLDGKRTWYFGGQPAEDGVGLSESEQILAGQRAAARCLPWVDLAGVDWRVFEIDRAEGRTAGGKRPSEAVVVWGSDRVIAAWPTKLVLAPRGAELVIGMLRERGILPGGGGDSGVSLSLPSVSVSDRVW